MDDIKAKQQVVEKIKEAGKILVTVSKNPSVDALSAAIGLTMLLDKQEKYSTALFSGQTPPAIAFLEPEKTFDDTTDSLRDFIIALNKEKADHLRYKVEGDSVKIFITPYKTTITEDDLIFSQGDYNVELVIALGVSDQNDLDSALENHGQILHDATVITMTVGDEVSTLGGIDYHDNAATSLSELIAILAEAMKDDKKSSLIDGPIATALLTGIVAETERFSNQHTTSKVMTLAASLMAAGADQQLIATELQKTHDIPAVEAPEDDDAAGTGTAADGSLTIKKDTEKDSLSVSHEGETLAELDERVRGKDNAASDEPLTSAIELAKEKAAEHEQVVIENAKPHSVYALSSDEATEEPTLGGSLSATTEQAAEDARRDADSDQNKTILTHSYLSGEPSAASATMLDAAAPAPQSAYALPSEELPIQETETAPSEAPAAETPAPEAVPADATTSEPPAVATVGGERVIQPLASAYEAQPPLQLMDTPAPAPAEAPAATAAPAPQPTPADLGLPLPPPIPDFSQGTPPPAIPLPPTQQPPILGDILASEQPPAQQLTIPQPEPPVPQPVTTPVMPTAPAAPADPGQFQIPGQPTQF